MYKQIILAIFANIIQIAAQKDDVAPWRWWEMDWTLPPLCLSLSLSHLVLDWYRVVTDRWTESL